MNEALPPIISSAAIIIIPKALFPFGIGVLLESLTANIGRLDAS